MARHCIKCGEEFEDWVEVCSECDVPLADGPAPEKAEEPEAIAEEPLQMAGPTREEIETYKTVWLGSAPDAEQLVSLMRGEGLRAMLAPLDEPFDNEIDRTVRIIVPPEQEREAAWFIKGFEKAFDLFGGPPGDE